MDTITATITVTPKVGDILCCAWGYDQTNVDFYKVLKVLSKSVIIQHIAAKVTEKGFMSGEAVPYEPHTVDKYDSETKTKRVNLDRDGYNVRISSYSTAFLWDGKPHYTSWYA